MKTKKFTQSFTIIELVTTCMIIMILVGLTVGVIFAALESARKRKTEVMIACIGTAIEMYNTDEGAFPDDTSNANLVNILQGNGYMEFKDEDLNGSGEVIDPWDTPYNYLVMADYAGTKWGNTTSYNLWSCGPNCSDDSYDGGAPDSDYGDDINNW